VREIAIPMDKRAIHLVDKLNFQNYGQEGKYLFDIRGILNRKMIDLAEDGAQFFFEQKIWDVSLADATLHIGETEREWEDKNTIWCLVLMVFFRIRHRMQHKACLITHKNFRILDTKN
jgi:kynurenine 3-monooxygenase